MITMTWTDRPRRPLRPGRRRRASVLRVRQPHHPARRRRHGAPFAPLQGTGVPAGGTVVRLREAFRQTGTQLFAHNYIGAKNDGTTLGIHTPGRPPS